MYTDIELDYPYLLINSRNATCILVKLATNKHELCKYILISLLINCVSNKDSVCRKYVITKIRRGQVSKSSVIECWRLKNKQIALVQYHLLVFPVIRQLSQHQFDR